MEHEKFFRKLDGGIVFHVHQSVGIDTAVDMSTLHQRTEQHFVAGDGWPNKCPDCSSPESVWSLFV